MLVRTSPAGGPRSRRPTGGPSVRVLIASAAIVLLAIGLTGCSPADPAEPAEVPRSTATPMAAPAVGPIATLVADRLPRVTYLGGRFLRHPTVHTVTFAGDDPLVVGELERFGDTITASAWWREAVRGYCAPAGGCIGDGRPGRHVRLPQLPAAVADVDIEAVLRRAEVDGRFGAIDADSLLMVYLPPGVTVSDAAVPRYCAGPRAFHQAFTLGGRQVPYAVVPRCAGLDQVTGSASHEILEATTNPDPARRGFALTAGSANLAFTAAGVEPADPCGLLSSPGPWVVADGFTVHRVWSNTAAATGKDPCVPAPADRPYLALVPDRPVVRVAADPVTVNVLAATDGAAVAWSIAAVELPSEGGSPYLDLAFDRAAISTGGRAVLAITVRRALPDTPVVVLLESTGRGQTYRWPLVVTA